MIFNSETPDSEINQYVAEIIEVQPRPPRRFSPEEVRRLVARDRRPTIVLLAVFMLGPALACLVMVVFAEQTWLRLLLGFSAVFLGVMGSTPVLVVRWNARAIEAALGEGLLVDARILKSKRAFGTESINATFQVPHPLGDFDELDGFSRSWQVELVEGATLPALVDPTRQKLLWLIPRARSGSPSLH